MSSPFSVPHGPANTSCQRDRVLSLPLSLLFPTEVASFIGKITDGDAADPLLNNRDTEGCRREAIAHPQAVRAVKIPPADQKQGFKVRGSALIENRKSRNRNRE